MKRRAISLYAIAFVGLFAATSCEKKESAETVAPQDAAAQIDGEEGAAVPKKVPQQPDPEEIAQARDLYLAGNYAQVGELLSGKAEGWEGDDRQRARALANAWLALAAVEEVPENAKRTAEAAETEARAVDDMEARQLANLAKASYLIGISDHPTACKVLERSVELSDSYLGLLHVIQGQCLINLAFEGEAIAHPEKLVAAQAEFEKARSDGSSAIVGRALEGLAAVAKYQGKRDQICPLVLEAKSSYEAASASEYLLEGPTRLAEESNCGQ